MVDAFPVSSRWDNFFWGVLLFKGCSYFYKMVQSGALIRGLLLFEILECNVYILVDAFSVSNRMLNDSMIDPYISVVYFGQTLSYVHIHYKHG